MIASLNTTTRIPFVFFQVLGESSLVMLCPRLGYERQKYIYKKLDCFAFTSVLSFHKTELFPLQGDLIVFTELYKLSFFYDVLCKP